MKKLIALFAMLGILLGSGLALGAGPDVTGNYFTTNYTVSSTNYAKGGSAMTIYTFLTGNDDLPGETLGTDTNVSAIIRNSTDDIVTTVYLENTTESGNGTWSGTWTVTDANHAGGNFTINATDSGGENSTESVTFFIDADDPSSSSLQVGGNANNFTWRGITGQTKNVTVSVTDNIAIDVVTIDFTSVPSGSTVTDGIMFCDAGGTSATCNYTFTPDKLGTYLFRINTQDNVTNTNNATDYRSIIFRLKGSTYPLRQPAAELPKPESRLPLSIEAPAPLTGLGSAIMGIPSMILDAIAGLFKPVLSVLGIL